MKIRKRRYASGNTAWQLDCGLINGRRDQQSFATKEEAVAEMARRKELLRQCGHQAFTLTDEERVRFAAARDRLRVAGASIDEAVDFYLKHAKPTKQPVRLSELIALCLEAKRKKNLSDRYLKKLMSSAETCAMAGHADTEVVQQRV